MIDREDIMKNAVQPMYPSITIQDILQYKMFAFFLLHSSIYKVNIDS